MEKIKTQKNRPKKKKNRPNWRALKNDVFFLKYIKKLDCNDFLLQSFFLLLVIYDLKSDKRFYYIAYIRPKILKNRVNSPYLDAPSSVIMRFTFAANIVIAPCICMASIPYDSARAYPKTFFSSAFFASIL